MMSRHPNRYLVRALLVLALVLPAQAHALPIVFQATGTTAPGIQATVDAFRASLGDNNGSTAGPLDEGRREINWDGGGVATPSVVGTPFSGFQDSRGALMTTPGSGFIQADPDDLASQFANASYEITFDAFSPLRLFVPIGSNVTDVTFSVPGTNGTVPATVSAFGAVFSDVDSDATTMQLFGPGDTPLGTFAVPSLIGDATFSFLGVLFDVEQIARVRITTGNAALGVPIDGAGGADVVVMDDFIYAEPVPEPGPIALLAFGVAGLAIAGPGRSRRAR
jgi:hypothetical protein